MLLLYLPMFVFDVSSAKTKDRFGGMMMFGAILSSPTFLWFIGFDDVSMRLQT